MPSQKCPLCLEVKPIVKSHLMPAQVYGYCRPLGGHPISVSSRIVIASDRQLQTDLLCLECEDVLNKGGETWLLPLLARYEGSFPFYDLLLRAAPDVADKDVTGYAAARNPEIQVDKLIHFAMGVFWKAAIHSWKGSETEPMIQLGPYAECVRTFLLGETAFPQWMTLDVGVLPPPVKDISFCFPYRGSNTGWFNFLFYVCGIEFALGAGKKITAEARQYCFARNPLHPIIVTDFSPYIRTNFNAVWRKARKAKNIEKWLKKS
jgi:hypothetical protein